MKKFALLGVAAGSLLTSNAFAAIFNDAAGDQWPLSGGEHLDITSVEVTNTDNDITFFFTLTGSAVATNWGKYGAIIRHAGPVTDTLAWNRNMDLTDGQNGWIASWVDQPADNIQAFTWDGASWLGGTVGSNVVVDNTVSITVSLASIGVMLGETIIFDAVSTVGGDGDTATDSLTGATPTDWQSPIEMDGLQYTVAPVPEPATMAILGLGAALAARRRRRS